jgi:hypothetical protein
VLAGEAKHRLLWMHRLLAYVAHWVCNCVDDSLGSLSHCDSSGRPSHCIPRPRNQLHCRQWDKCMYNGCVCRVERLTCWGDSPLCCRSPSHSCALLCTPPDWGNCSLIPSSWLRVMHTLGEGVKISSPDAANGTACIRAWALH